jgi:hypothetical protein
LLRVPRRHTSESCVQASDVSGRDDRFRADGSTAQPALSHRRQVEVERFEQMFVGGLEHR